jgi:hypothetical protein
MLVNQYVGHVRNAQLTDDIFFPPHSKESRLRDLSKVTQNLENMLEYLLDVAFNIIALKNDIDAESESDYGTN